MNRRLLPYEHELIQTLGVSKEEYLAFIAIKQDYEDPKAGTDLDIRAFTGGAGEAALILTIIGTLFQVASVLLLATPSLPKAGMRQQRREKRIAPRSGFNSTLELSEYGDTVPLVYTNINKNPNGGVRVNGSLVWSAVETIGGNHFASMMMVLGAGHIKSINADKTALGQLPLSEFPKERAFVYFKNGPSSNPDTLETPTPGALTLGDLKRGISNSHPYELYANATSTTSISSIKANKEFLNGYSQAYSPSTAIRFGIYDPIPINVAVFARQPDGDLKSTSDSDDLIVISDSTYSNHFGAGDSLKVNFKKLSNISPKKADKKPHEVLADDIREIASESLDMSALYMFGTARYRLDNISGDHLDLRGNDVSATFKVIDNGEGKRPATLYNDKKPYTKSTYSESARRNLLDKLAEIDNEEDIEDQTGKNLDIDLRDYDAPLRAVGFSGSFNHEFKSTTRVSWERIKLRDLNTKGTEVETQRVGLVTKSENLDNGGSIQFSRSRRADHLEELEEFNVDVLKVSLKAQRRNLRKSIEAISSGLFDRIRDSIDRSPANGLTWEEYVEQKYISPSKIEHKNTFKELNDLLEDAENQYEEFLEGKGSNRVKFGPVIKIDDQDINVTTTAASQNGTANGRVGKTIDFATLDGLIKEWAEGAHSNNGTPFTNFGSKFALRGVSRGNSLQLLKKGTKTESSKFDGAAGKLYKLGVRILGLQRQIDKFKKEGLAFIRNYHTKRLTDGIYSNERVQDSRRPEQFTGPLLNSSGTPAYRTIDMSIDKIEELLNDLPDHAADTDGKDAIKGHYRTLIQNKKNCRDQLKYLTENWDDLIDDLDDFIFTKAICKYEEGQYQTVSPCDIVKFNMKATLFRRINGRQSKYGDTKEKGPKGNRIHSDSDNGLKNRIAFFKVEYKEHDRADFVTTSTIFAVRRCSESANYFQLQFKIRNENRDQRRMVFRFLPISDVQAEINDNNQTHIGFIETDHSTSNFHRTSEDSTYSGSLIWHGRHVSVTASEGLNNALPETRPKGTNEWDLFSTRSDTKIDFSFGSGPEFEIVNVTEQQRGKAAEVEFNENQLYGNLSMLGLHLYAGRNIQDIRSVTAFVERGKGSFRTLVSGQTYQASYTDSSTSYASDIFLDTLLDKTNGVGRFFASSFTTDQTWLKSLHDAKNFLRSNHLPTKDGGTIQLFMDGVIADRVAWRAFWMENAPFSLLELARKNGRDTLVPAIPVESSGRAAEESGVPVELKIAALYTTGNILEGSYKEEFLDFGSGTQDMIATVVYRDQGAATSQVFSTNRSVTVKRKEAKEGTSIEQTFDGSQFITQREQAIMFGKLMVNQRHFIKKAIEFKTTPKEAAIEPGSFIWVDIGMQRFDDYSIGVVMEGGELNIPLLTTGESALKDGNYTFLLYSPDVSDADLSTETSITVTTAADGTINSTLPSKYDGYMFVLGSQNNRKRVFRVNEIAIEEEGEVAVKAVEYPCFSQDGKLRASIADFRNDNFDFS